MPKSIKLLRAERTLFEFAAHYIDVLRDPKKFGIRRVAICQEELCKVARVYARVASEEEEQNKS